MTWKINNIKSILFPALTNYCTRRFWVRMTICLFSFTPEWLFSRYSTHQKLTVTLLCVKTVETASNIFNTKTKNIQSYTLHHRLQISCMHLGPLRTAGILSILRVRYWSLHTCACTSHYHTAAVHTHNGTPVILKYVAKSLMSCGHLPHGIQLWSVQNKLGLIDCWDCSCIVAWQFPKLQQAACLWLLQCAAVSRKNSNSMSTLSWEYTLSSFHKPIGDTHSRYCIFKCVSSLIQTSEQDFFF